MAENQSQQITASFNENHANDLLKYLYDCWKNEIYCDIVVNVGERTFKTHRFVLAMISEYFRAFIQHDSEDQGTLTLHDVDEGIFEAILTFAYTATINFDAVNLESLAISADFLGITQIKDECEKQMMADVPKDNCLTILVFSDIYSMPQLFEKSKKVWCKHYVSISSKKAFFQLPARLMLLLLKDNKLLIYDSPKEQLPLNATQREKLLFNSVLKYISANINKDITEELLELLKAVKLPKLAYKYMHEKVKKYKNLKGITKILTLLELSQSFNLKDKMSSFPEYWYFPRYPVLHDFEISRSFASGGEVGQYQFTHFDLNQPLNPFIEIRHVKLWIRRWDGRPVLGAICIQYSDSTCLSAGETREINSMDFHEVELEDGEYITKICLRTGWMIDSLKFQTNKGNQYGPFGGDGGSMHVSCGKEEESYLHSIMGAAVSTQGLLGIVHLAFRWVSFT